MGSWDFFTLLLEQANVITTPGAGFGPSGEGYIRLTAFGDAEATKEAVARIEKLLEQIKRYTLYQLENQNETPQWGGSQGTGKPCPALSRTIGAFFLRKGETLWKNSERKAAPAGAV